MLLNLLLLKYLFSGMIVLEAYIAYKILCRLSPRLAIAGAIFIAWNPVMLFEYSANGHNDVVMMLFVLLGILALVKERPVLALTLITASSLVKYTTVLLIPLFLLYAIQQLPTFKARFRLLLLAAISSLALTVILYIPFWHGMQTFSDSLLAQDQHYLTSFSTSMNYFFPSQISLYQGKQIGRIMFVPFYFYALYLCTRCRLLDLLFGSFIALFFLQVFALSNFNSWYAVWPLVIAAVIPRRVVQIVALLFAYGTTVSVGGFQFGLRGFGFTSYNWGMVSTFGYFVTFTPAVLLLFVLAMRRFLKEATTCLD